MTQKKKTDPRKMMEKAIAVIKRSIHELRADKKTSPLVGAVLVKPDGDIETAYRGELREGDHAEFSLLERKKTGPPNWTAPASMSRWSPARLVRELTPK